MILEDSSWTESLSVEEELTIIEAESIVIEEDSSVTTEEEDEVSVT